MLYVIKHKGRDPYWEYERYVQFIYEGGTIKTIHDPAKVVSFFRSVKKYATVFTDFNTAFEMLERVGDKFDIIPCKDDDSEIIKGLL